MKGEFIMTLEFTKSTQRFGVKKAVETVYPDEAIVKFGNQHEIEKFFNDALNSRTDNRFIQQIADRFAPSYCRRSIKSSPQLSNQERLNYLFAEIDKGNANVILKNSSLKLDQNDIATNNDEKEKGYFEKIDIMRHAEKYAKHLRKIYSKIFHSGYHLLEKVIHIPEDSPPGSILVTIDTSSIRERSTGWKDWDIPFEYKSFGALKALVVFDLALATRLSKSAFTAAAAGWISEDTKCQYNIVEKSILCKKWYGSYCIRFNLRLWDYEIAWVKYQKSDPAERFLVELNRTDRVVKNKAVLFTGTPKSIGPMTSMESFLSDYKKGFIPPDHDINTPIRINRGLLG